MCACCSDTEPSAVLIVRELLEHGADWRARDKAGRQPLMVAVTDGNLRAVQVRSLYSSL